jgi:hypothetical protein
MATDQKNRIEEMILRPLTRQELDQRIQHLAGEIASPGGEESLEPRWITSEELVRRMKRFIVHN